LFYHLYHLHSFKIFIILQSVRNGFSGIATGILLDTFARLRKTLVSSYMSVCSLTCVSPSAWINSALTGLILTKLYIRLFFEHLWRKIQFTLKSDKHNGTFKWKPKHIMIMCRSVFLIMKNVSDRSCSENSNAHFTLSNIFLKACRSWGNVETVVQLDRPQKTIQYGA
jgi:glucose-6-phosphate-specific signal transduction histidine kinase